MASDNSPTDRLRLARRLGGMTVVDFEGQLDVVRLRTYRLERLQEQLRRQGCPACVLFDPLNVRYATGTRNTQIWSKGNPSRCAFVPGEGRVVLFEYQGFEHLGRELETIGEVRSIIPTLFFLAGSRAEDNGRRWAEVIAELVREHCGADERRVAIDRLDFHGSRALSALGFELLDAQPAMEFAACVKSPEELACISQSIAVAETAIARIREALAPGLTENQLWSVLHQTNVSMGGEWSEYRLLASGPRTNPWGLECSDRVIRAGDLVAFDTGLVGPFGYDADLSRTLHCGPGRPSEEQRRLYRLAHEHLETNIALIRAGMSLREIAECAWPIPEEFVSNRYSFIAHGVGMMNQYPAIYHAIDFDTFGYDGVIEEGMTLSVESYIGAEGALEGVKLEEQVLVTARGCERLSTFPFEESLLA